MFNQVGHNIKDEGKSFITLKISASALRKVLTNLNQLQIQNLLNFTGEIQIWIHNFNVKPHMIIHTMSAVW